MIELMPIEDFESIMVWDDNQEFDKFERVADKKSDRPTACALMILQLKEKDANSGELKRFPSMDELRAFSKSELVDLVRCGCCWDREHGEMLMLTDGLKNKTA